MEIVAVRVPMSEGSKVILKVVVITGEIDEAGISVTLKSAAFVPPISTYGDDPVSVSTLVPKFRILNVFSTVPVVMSALPKFVKFEVLVVKLPFSIGFPLPVIAISGATPVP